MAEENIKETRARKPRARLEREEEAMQEARPREPTREQSQEELAELKKETALINADVYLKTGAHIGTQNKTDYMRKYIFKTRKDGLKVMDIEVIDKRISDAARLLSNYAPENIVAVSRKLYGQTPVQKFAEAINARAITGRFVPGTLTNPEGKEFFEVQAMIVTEPDNDAQAVREAKRMNVPVIALASTNNDTRDIDLVIPVNNKGRKSLALVYWLIAREFIKLTGASAEKLSKTFEDFEYKLKEPPSLGNEMHE